MSFLLRHFLRPRSRLARRARRAVRGRRGLEVGGPSRIFSAKGRLPVYPVLGSLDGADFRAETVWRPGRDKETADDVDVYVWAPNRPEGRLHLCEALDLAPIPDGAYEFVLASHVLEHVANPLAALATWRRVTKPAGALLLVVPHREGTFDHRRPVTGFPHLLEDRDRGTAEDDLTHLEEILALHDVSLDPGVESLEALAVRSRDNAANRCLHHHVFDTALLLRALDAAAWAIAGVDAMQPYHIAVLATKPRPGEAIDNGPLLAPEATWRRRSPFLGDRI